MTCKAQVNKISVIKKNTILKSEESFSDFKIVFFFFSSQKFEFPKH